MYRLMFIQFLRTNTCKLGLFLILVLGIISILIGKQFLNTQEKIATQVAKNQAEHIERNITLHSDDIGLLLYYLKFAAIKESSPLAGLSIGQKDLIPSVQSVSILTLEGQKYDTDLVNPTKLLFGNLDLSFIIIYVFPLLIIAFNYNLRSEEEENGTWRLVNVLSTSTTRFLLMKLSIRVVLLLITMSILYVIAGLSFGISWGTSYLAFFLISLLYLAFWFALSFWIVSFKRNSNFNALSLLSIWLILLVLLPAALNNRVTNKYPIPEAFTTMIKQRDGYHKKWDTNKRATMEKFYVRYPQFESYGYPPEEGFNWWWYYAMQHLGDEESSEESQKMLAKFQQREQMSRQWGQFIPTIHTQLAFNNLAGTSINNHFNFLSYLNEFHEQTRLYFYPKIYSNVNAKKVDWSQFEPAYFPNSNDVNFGALLVPLLLSILMFVVLAFVNVRRF